MLSRSFSAERSVLEKQARWKGPGIGRVSRYQIFVLSSPNGTPDPLIPPGPPCDVSSIFFAAFRDFALAFASHFLVHLNSAALNAECPARLEIW
jgi:hypothetical protein